MKRREFLKSVAGTGAGALLAGCTPSRTAPPNRPNVIFIFADQLRADICGVYGGRNIETPHIDRLAREGVTFEHGLSTCPLCTPYRGMLMTGRYPTHSGLVLTWLDASPEQNPQCLGNVFAAAGYETGFIGKWHLTAGHLREAGKVLPRQAQMKEFRQLLAELELRYPHSEFVEPGPNRLGFDFWAAYNFHTDFNHFWYYGDEARKIVTEGYETDVEFDLAIDYLEKRRNAEQPFFLVLAPHPPHPPFKAGWCPAGYLDRIPQELQWRPKVPHGDPRRMDQLTSRCYYAMTKNMDDNLGRLLDFLDRAGISGNTVLVFTSDHGEMLGSHGRMAKLLPYAESVGAPLIMRWPGRIPANVRINALYTPIEHLPTLSALAGIAPSQIADGVDLSPVVLGHQSSDREAVLMMNYSSHFSFFQTGTYYPEWRGVHTGQHTYVKWLDGKEELYDNHQDPYQMQNLAGGQVDLATLSRLRRRLEDLLAEAHDDFLPGTAYADWYGDGRDLIKTGLGPVDH